MSYSITRTIVSIIIFAILLCIYIKMKKRETRNFRIKFFCIIVLFLGIYIPWGFIPVENIFLSFNSVEKAFKYKHPKSQIIEIFDYKDFSTVIYSGMGVDNFYKKDNKWKLMRSPKTKVTSVYNNECFLTQTFTPSNMVAITVNCTDLKAISNEIEQKNYIVTDSNYIELKKETFNWENSVGRTQYFYAMFEDSEKFIIINGEKIYF